MKKGMVIILLFISGMIGGFFSFIFLIASALGGGGDPQLNVLSNSINQGLFFGSLLIILFSFFFREKFKSYYGAICIIFGIGYLLLGFLLPVANYMYLIPTFLYFIASSFSLLYRQRI